MKNHKVSFLMTIFNHQNYLKDSITSGINQSYKNWELIAIDNLNVILKSALDWENTS